MDKGFDRCGGSEACKPYLAAGPLRIAILGDSISNDGDEWPYTVKASYNGGDSTIINHAVAGHNIISNMDADTVAAASDDAYIIYIMLGRNDNNAGDMEALQAEYEENIAELKGTNPNATIYAITPLPAWTDVGGGTEVEMGNIRTAITAAGAAQGVTVLDGYTGPAIVVGDTLDGTHLTTGASSGTEKFAAWILTVTA